MTKKTGDQVLVAEMAPGPDGFVLATFKEEVEVKQTEEPGDDPKQELWQS